MLNVSKNIIEGKIHTEEFQTFSLLKNHKAGKIFLRVLSVLFLILLVVIFLPWTQNISSRGYVTTLQPEQRPQMIQSVIGGKIEKWFIREGDFVHKGDTLLFISEVKDQYFDPELLKRTELQIKAKEQSVNSYGSKVQALGDQIKAFKQTRDLKIEQAVNYIQQAKLKVQSDSMDYQAANTNYEISLKQLNRMEKLYENGLKSLTELESRKLKLQESQAKKIGSANKLQSSRNQLINAKVELNSLKSQFKDKLAKLEADKYTALSNSYDAQAGLTKMQNQYKNYLVRKGLYHITSPQDGYITKTIRSGIGETIKEGEVLISIMPADYDLAVEMYVHPMDLPLLEKEQKVRFVFDGWPSIVFSGWPNLSFGTFGGEIVAIDNFISDNGKYRILVAADSNDVPWPDDIRVGAGAYGVALLKEVPIWYELWRKLNGFPPDYYKSAKVGQAKDTKKS
ncbi:HlyD family secretion protein [Xanthovirga aplysinae]|uniref:HlyD family secretion protein n=1 Tax=Xanthovirga aplysinae TaxID=2529853 RepID=UPI0012BB77A9|nr:biotin/lipoyl-binding protein [Xanthovirga aplysinae]MTI32974.1 HlyD family efflux transporter periplasmic adaptor subunit [Xanthovirga aplysinae]